MYDEIDIPAVRYRITLSHHLIISMIYLITDDISDKGIKLK